MPSPSLGSLAWRNWRLCLESSSQPLITEHGLFTDALFPPLAETTIELGPFVVVGSWLGPGRGTGAARAYLRIKHYLNAEDYDATEASSESFHGGRIHDEFAALLSLEFGVRLQAGPSQREYAPELDALGRPTSFEPLGQRLPVLQVGHFGDMLPGTRRMVAFGELSLLPRLAELSADDSVAVARSARLYQDAVWYADAQPWLSWLLLVSAVEVVSSRWAALRFGDDVANFRDARPDIVKALEDAGHGSAIQTVAKQLAAVSGATRRFREFLMEFLPDAPDPRSIEPTQTSWTRDDLRVAFTKIYSHRFKALHGGRPFPGILCLPPQVLNNVPNERPLATAVATQHASWTIDDLPFNLHIFSYIVRRAVLSWWRSVLPSNPASSA